MQARGINSAGGMPGRPIAGPSTGGIPSISRMGSHPHEAPQLAAGQRQTGLTALGHDVLQGQASKRRKPAIDRHLPLFYSDEHSSTRESDEVLQALRESYTSLEALEKKLDWTLSRKKAEYGELIGKGGTHAGQPKGKLGGVRRDLRLLLSHEIIDTSGASKAANKDPADGEQDAKPEVEGQQNENGGQPQGENEASTQPEPQRNWTFKIGGRLQQEAEEEKIPFSSLVNAVYVDILPEDPNAPEAVARIEWRPQNKSAPLDGLALTRPLPVREDGADNSPLKLRVTLHLDQHPERYKLIEPVSRFLDIQEESKAGCLLALWAYIKKHELQESDNRQMIKCDPFLALLTSKQVGQQIYFYHLGEFLMRWMQRPDPVVLHYSMDLSKSSTSPEAYDISMSVADPVGGAIEKFLSLLAGHSSTITGIVQSDLTLAQACSRAKTAKNKRDICAAFSTDPIQFIFDYLESQSIDLDNYLNEQGERGAMAALGGPTPNLEDLRRSSYWQNAEWSDEAVRLFSQRQLATKAMGVGQAAGAQCARR